MLRLDLRARRPLGYPGGGVRTTGGGSGAFAGIGLPTALLRIRGMLYIIVMRF